MISNAILFVYSLRGVPQKLRACVTRDGAIRVKNSTFSYFDGTNPITVELNLTKGKERLAKFVRYNKVCMFYYYWSKENCSLYRGLRYIEVRYIEVPL